MKKEKISPETNLNRTWQDLDLIPDSVLTNRYDHEPRMWDSKEVHLDLIPDYTFVSHRIPWDTMQEFLNQTPTNNENEQTTAGLNHDAQSTSFEGLCSTPAKRRTNNSSRNPKKLGVEGQSPRPAEGAEKFTKKGSKRKKYMTPDEKLAHEKAYWQKWGDNGQSKCPKKFKQIALIFP